MTKSEATRRLTVQLEQVEALRARPRFSPEFKKWYRDTEVLIEKVFGEGSRHAKDFTSVHYEMMAWSSNTPDSEHTRAFSQGLNDVKPVLQSFITEIQEYWKDDEGDTKAAAPTSGDVIRLICERFHLVAKQLRSRHDNRPSLEIEDEYDVQDLFHALLQIYFDDVRTEEWTPSYAGGASRMDFLLKNEQTVIELKKTRKGLGAKDVGDQLLIDIGRYQEHPYCRFLVCFVYDPEGRLANPKGIESDLSGERGTIKVDAIIRPKGA